MPKKLNSNLLLAGKINSTHGVKGFIKVYSYLENPNNFKLYKFYLNDGTPIILATKFIKKSQVICQFNDVSTIEDAEKLAGTEIYIKRDELPESAEGEFYFSDLVGLKVLNHSNKEDMGEVVAIHNFGAGDIIEIKKIDNKPEMLSFNKETFPVVDIDNGLVEVSLPVIEFDNEES